MRALLAAFVATLSLASMPALAQQRAAQCGPAAIGFAHLSSAYHEVPVWAGQVGADRAVVLTQSPDGSTWTLVVVQGDTGCLIGAGKNGRLAKPQ